MHLSILPSSNISLTISFRVLAMSMKQIIIPRTLILWFIMPTLYTITFFQTLYKFPNIYWPINFGLFSFSMQFIFLPLTIVYVSVCTFKYPIAICSPGKKVTLIFIIIWKLKYTFSTHLPIVPLSFIGWFILEPNLFTMTMLYTMLMNSITLGLIEHCTKILILY